MRKDLLKNFYFSIDVVKSGKEKDKFFVEGYAATSDLDRQNDIIALEALHDAAPKLLENGNTVFFNHDYNRCVGRLDESYADENGLKVKIYVSEWEQELRKKIEENIINKFSIGGRVVSGQRVSAMEAMRRYPEKFKSKPKESINIIDKMELFEVSIVGLPANAKAEFVHKSLSAALKEIDMNEEVVDIDKKEDLGQIPDNVSEENPGLPKPIAKEEIPEVIKCDEPCADCPCAKKECNDPDCKDPECEVHNPKEEPKIEEKTIEPATEKQVEETAPTTPAAAKDVIVTTTTETRQEVVTQTVTEGKVEVKQEVMADEKVETVVNDTVKITETQQVQAVRTYTEEEIQKMHEDYQKQLTEKDAMITSLEAEVNQMKVEKVNQATLTEKLDMIVKDVSELNAKVKEIPVETKKASPLVVKDEKKVVKDETAEGKFLKTLLKRK